MIIIGLAGYEGAGKDTVADIIVEDNPGFVKLGLADPLKRLAAILDPCLPVHSKKWWRPHLSQLLEEYGPEDVKKIEAVRRFYQILGTEGCREIFGDDCWLKAADKEIARLESLGVKGVVVKDVRFKNEGHWADTNGILAWVDNQNVKPVNEHPSAQGEVKVDCRFIINNNETIEDLRYEVERFMNNVYRNLRT